MSSVFGTSQVHRGSFRADGLQLQIGGTGASGFLVQSIQFAFQQAISPLYELGSRFVYYVGGRAIGNAGLNWTAGPTRFTTEFFAKFRDMCNPQDLAFSANNVGCASSAAGTASLDIELIDAVNQSVQGSVAVADSLISQSASFIYLDLLYD